jgi:hypothetical protein
MADGEPPVARVVEFSCVLVGNDAGGWSSVRLPKRVHHALGGDAARIPIVGTADGHAIRTSAMPMEGHHWFVFNRQMREATGKSAGDRVTFRIRRDLAERTVETPDDLARALAGHKALADFFESMSFSHRKEFIAFIDGAKQAETRARRVAKTVAKLAEARAERLAKDADRAVRSGQGAAEAKRLAKDAAKVAKTVAKDAALIAATVAKAAAYEYEDRLHDAALRGATALELGVVKAAGLVRGLVSVRRKVRKGGGL